MERKGERRGVKEGIMRERTRETEGWRESEVKDRDGRRGRDRGWRERERE